jgi:AcrR family transcriptional regulator
MTAAVTTSLIDRRRDHVSKDIRHIAMRLFDEHGFEQVSVQDVAEAAGMSARTFFRYFASKDDILLDYQRLLLGRLCDALRARPADEGAVTALRQAYIATSTVAPQDHADVVQRARVLAAAPALRARARGEEASGQGEVADLVADRMGVDRRKDSRPSIVTAALAAAATAAWDDWLARGGVGDPSRRVAAAIDLIADGVAALDELRPRRRATT